MEKKKNNGSEITVRISVTLLEAPDIHTLLAMTPVRDRGKLMRQTLKHYICTTNHPAGDLEIQIETVTKWLRTNSEKLKCNPYLDEALNANTEINNVGVDERKNTDDRGKIFIEMEGRKKNSNEISDLNPGRDSVLISRWLNS